MSFGILGTGYCVPDEVRTNEWWPRSFVERFEERARGDVTTPEVVLARAKDEDQRIQLEEMLPTIGDPFRGSRERRIAPDGTHCSDLEVEAARRALTAAGVAPSELRFIIEYSWPPDRPVPNNASLVQHRLEAYEAVALEVDSACCSFLSGLRVAEASAALRRTTVSSGTRAEPSSSPTPRTSPSATRSCCRPAAGHGRPWSRSPPPPAFGPRT
jgi:3-oxoacyl-[acyl-carrier-protein] synthase-3